jgi:hypothetical protein
MLNSNGEWIWMDTGYPISILGFVLFAFTVPPALAFLASFFFLTKLGSRLGSEDFITKHGETQDNAPTGPTQEGTGTCST